MNNERKPVVEFSCAACHQQAPSAGEVEEHFYRTHGRSTKVVQHFGMTLADAAKRALELGFDIEE